MQTLRDVLKQAEENRVAIGHFNVADLVLLKAVFAAAQELKVPVMIGVSEGEREFMGVRQIAVLVRSLRDEFDFPIFLNADHTHSLSKAIDAAKAGLIQSYSIFRRCRSTKTCAKPKRESKHSKRSTQPY